MRRGCSMAETLVKSVPATAADPSTASGVCPGVWIGLVVRLVEAFRHPVES